MLQIKPITMVDVSVMIRNSVAYLDMMRAFALDLSSMNIQNIAKMMTLNKSPVADT